MSMMGLLVLLLTKKTSREDIPGGVVLCLLSGVKQTL